MCKAAINYNPKANYTFSTYAVQNIIGSIKRELLPYKRSKRGYGYKTQSLDALYDTDLEFQYRLIDNTNVEETALNNAMCRDIWKLVPTYYVLDRYNVTVKELGEYYGVSRACIYNHIDMELRNARKVLEGKKKKERVSA